LSLVVVFLINLIYIMTQSNLYDNLNKLTSDELIEKYKSGYYTDDAKDVVVEIFKERNISVPLVDENYSSTKIPFYKSHPIWFWTLFGASATLLTRLIQRIVNSF